ncbi:BTAD domain-containing putative transcriptional regulator [Nonomuraea sp. NPDC000554]|uniref:BTAD domain-containing putative transcriptional regulator n=1 Tax=Nonomuraea sp. NPDC000554 TaxID=3154259 RepID=UPI003328FAA4
MRVGILGPLEVDGPAVGGARLRRLLARLALAAGQTVTVEQLSEALWPDDQPGDPANALQSLVSRLRRLLPDPSALASTPGGYRLDAATDAHDFDRLTAQARRAGSPAERARLLDAALRLWRGPALGELAGAPFAVGYAARLEEARLTAVEEHAEAELAAITQLATARGGLASLIARLSELTARHPLRERLHATRIKALHAAGRDAEALAAYEEARRRLADELGADPGPELRDIHLALLRPEPVRPARTNLRAPLTSFVGRAGEIDRIRAQLRQGRLVTLVGPGGAGKTRLATTVAAALLQEGVSVSREDTPNGDASRGGRPAVWLVELASVSDPRDVPQAVLSVLGQAPLLGGARDTIGRLVDVVGTGQVLLVLDNCEHLLDPVARLAEELLGRCPRLRILATSREPLALVGEALCPVPPLPPDPAVELFTDRVTAVQPGFALTGENEAGVREVCRRLDGLPLAIELAAARLRALTLEQLASRLDDRFVLLTGGSRTALPRHQTLRAVVAWSWDLLDEPERRLAERLAVFPGTFDLAAAEHLGSLDAGRAGGPFGESAEATGHGAAPPGGTLDLLAALVDKSLLHGDGQGRYRMLETIREYGLERLSERGHAAPVRAAHAAYFLRFAERAEPFLRTGEQLVWMAKLTSEEDNVLAALHFAVDTEDADTAVRLAAAVSQFWTSTGRRMEAVGWLRMALRVPGDAPLAARAVATAMCLLNTATAGGFARLDDVLEEMRVVASVTDPDRPVLALLEPSLALFTDSTEHGLRIIQGRLDHPDPWARGVLRMIRAAILENDGDMAASRADLVIAVEQLTQVGERWALSMALTSLAETHSAFGDFDGAIGALRRAIVLIQELNPGDDAGHQRVGLATCYLCKGDVRQARAELMRMVEAGEHEMAARNVSFARLGLGDLARLEGDLDEAARQYAHAHELMGDASFIAPQFRALMLVARAHLAVALADPATAAAQVARAVALALKAMDMPVVGRIGVASAAVAAADGDPRRAAVLLGMAHGLRGAPDMLNPDIARLAERLRATLGPDEYGKAYDEGRDADREQALALVRHPRR